jgi:hypothetical protein
LSNEGRVKDGHTSRSSSRVRSALTHFRMVLSSWEDEAKMPIRRDCTGKHQSRTYISSCSISTDDMQRWCYCGKTTLFPYWTHTDFPVPRWQYHAKMCQGWSYSVIPIKDIYNCFRRLKEHRQMFQIEDRQITKIGKLFHICSIPDWKTNSCRTIEISRIYQLSWRIYFKVRQRR